MEKKLTPAQQKIIDEMKATGAAIEASRIIRNGWVYRLNGRRINDSVVAGLVVAGAIQSNHVPFALDRKYSIKD